VAQAGATKGRRRTVTARCRLISSAAMAYREGEALVEADRSTLVVGLGGNVVGLDRATGAVRWKNVLSGGGLEEVFIALRYGVLAVSAGGKGVYRLDYATGATLWRSETTAPGRATILVELDLIIVAKGGYLDTFGHDGLPRWSQPLEGMGIGRVALALPGNIAQADDPGSQ